MIVISHLLAVCALVHPIQSVHILIWFTCDESSDIHVQRIVVRVPIDKEIAQLRQAREPEHNTFFLHDLVRPGMSGCRDILLCTP